MRKDEDSDPPCHCDSDDYSTAKHHHLLGYHDCDIYSPAKYGYLYHDGEIYYQTDQDCQHLLYPLAWQVYCAGQ